MERYIVIDHWGAIVRDKKDSEKEYDIPAYTTERLAREILDVVQNSRFRQPVLFHQHRGQEYEEMVEKLNGMFDPSAVQRMLTDEVFWDATFAMV